MIGDNIKKFRKKKGSTQDELARKTYIPYTTLTKLESNVVKKPIMYLKKDKVFVRFTSEVLDFLSDIVFYKPIAFRQIYDRFSKSCVRK